ncbi:hypothetical protein Bca52824_047772 [Brassica carinata]|uniref:Uncharacterized protein n=1 Tax=Brassica carinata TaxID=52824 RepID=A0A8X7RJL1_BRACI|nr:hypothetical protein Bca52824_047772 [Brassica carinata]
MTMMVTNPPSCLRPPPDPPPSSDVFDFHLQTLSTKNTQFEHQASSLNLICLSRTSKKLFPSPLLTGSSTLATYAFLTVDILLLWSITQCRRLYTAPTEPISRLASIFVIGVSGHTSGSPSRPPNGVFLVISPPLLHFMFTELRIVKTSIFVFGEMAFYVMPDKFSRIGVLDSTATPNSLLLFALDIHLVSPGSLIGVRADITRLTGCLAKSKSSSDNFALF